MTKGIIIGGSFGEIFIRQKSSESIEMGELLVSETNEEKIILQVHELIYGSQISRQNLELISGMELEENESNEFYDKNLRLYNISYAKPLITIKKNAKLTKSLPTFFSKVREIKKEDLNFLTTNNPLYIGQLRSGSKIIDTDIFLPGKDVLTHHILIPATTGRGKSNLLKVILWNLAKESYCGILVLDPHDEYYGRNNKGLKDSGTQISYYSINPPVGQRSLKINIKNIKPHHFNGVMSLSDPQKQAMQSYYKEYGIRWIEAIVFDKPLNSNYFESTIAVVKRMILNILGLEVSGEKIYTHSIFETESGQSTITDICNELENSSTVIIDTSTFSGSVEILIGSLISSEIFSRYKKYKTQGTLDQKPVISVVLEEAPRVLGKEVLERGSNIFSTIAREGRKFKVGLTAITQLPSLIPRQILANMNTKIILGIEMAPERQAIIDSASQDLSKDNRNIASLDKGEAIITSNFAKFAIPLKIPLFEEYVKDRDKNLNIRNDFSGIKL